MKAVLACVVLASLIGCKQKQTAPAQGSAATPAPVGSAASSGSAAPAATGSGSAAVATHAATDAANVTLVASKIEGGRTEEAVNPWLEGTCAPYIKPCFKDAPAGWTFNVTFELAKDGKTGAPTVQGGTDTFKPADAAIAACVEKALAPLKLDGAADAPTTVTAIFVIQ